MSKVQNPYDRQVEILWIDSRSGYSEWQFLNEYKDELTTYVIRSVGFVLREDDRIIHIAAHVHVDPNDGDIVFSGDVQIPKVSIQKIWDIN